MIRYEKSDITIREVTTDSLPKDLASKHLNLHPELIEPVSLKLATGGIDILLAEAAEDGGARGQVVIDWTRPELPALRKALKLEEGEKAPGLSFMEVPAPYRGSGIGGLLLRTTLDRVYARQHGQACVAVERANTGASRFFQSHGFQDVHFEFEGTTFHPNNDGTFGVPQMVLTDILAVDLTALQASE